MAERKCVYPPIAEASKGRAICSDGNFRAFRLKDKCPSCPKAQNVNRIFFASEQLSDGEWAAIKFLNPNAAIIHEKSRGQVER